MGEAGVERILAGTEVGREISVVQGKWIGCAPEGDEVPDLGSPSSPHACATLRPHPSKP